jgi:hypothetical protein
VAGITLGRVIILRNRSDKILHKRSGGHGDPASLASRSAAEVIRSVRAGRRQSLWLSPGGRGRRGWRHGSEEALQGGEMTLEARVLTRPPIFSSALVVAVMKARRVTCWCGTSKLARLPREEES